MMLCVNRCLMICFSLPDSKYKAIELPGTAKEQGICQQMNTDESDVKFLNICGHPCSSVDDLI